MRIQTKTMVDVSTFKDPPSVGAIVWSSFNGMYQGKAMAELLLSPSHRDVHAGQLSAHRLVSVHRSLAAASAWVSCPGR